MLRRFTHFISPGILFLTLSFTAFAASGNASSDSSKNQSAAVSKDPGYGFDPGEVIMEHIMDSHEWHFFDLRKTDGEVMHFSVCLPLILYTPGVGFNLFSYKDLKEGAHDGFILGEDNQITRSDGKMFFDFSITKDVLQMLIAVAFMLLLFISVAGNYKKYGTKAPRGIQSALEVVVLFIRDEVAKPMLGAKANIYLPYLLTVFFFIWINNLLGLFPGAANVTGNIAVTMTLACFTFLLMMVGSKRHYWYHMFVPQGVPYAVWPILIPMEFISNVIVKPFALMIRLFANMLAGHLIVLSFLIIIFIFTTLALSAGLGASIFSIGFSIFIYLLELLVAVLQAYIFTILSALFIGETTAHANAHESAKH